MLELGIFFAFGALIAWGFGDFIIQRSSKKFGDWETLFIISLTGTAMLVPFVYNDIFVLFSGDLLFLMIAGASVTLVLSGLLQVEALRRGKLTIVEPVMTLEVPVAAVFAFIVASEFLEPVYVILIGMLLAGIVMVSLKPHHLSRKLWIEKGVVLALAGSLFLGITNFLVGAASRASSPLVAIWFICAFGTVMGFFYLMSNHKLGKMAHDFSINRKFLLSVGIVDNLGWLAFAFSVTTVPIGIAAAISEGYVALAALLGIAINREALIGHQKVGLVVVLCTAVALAAVYG